MQETILKNLMLQKHALFYKPEGGPRVINAAARGYAQATVDEMWKLYPGEGEEEKANRARVQRLIPSKGAVVSKAKNKGYFPEGELLSFFLGCRHCDLSLLG